MGNPFSYMVDNDWIDVDSDEVQRLLSSGGKAAVDDYARQMIAAKTEQPFDLGEGLREGVTKSADWLMNSSVLKPADWLMNSSILKPVSDALRQPGMKPMARALVPGYSGIEAITGGISGAGAAYGATMDQPANKVPDLGSIIKNEAGEGIHAAIETVAPIDVATLGLGGAAGIAGRSGLRGARALSRAAQVADLLEGAFGGSQVIGGVGSGDWGEVGVGAARMAGGLGGLASIKSPVPENLFNETRLLEDSLSRGEGGEAAIARLNELEARAADLTTAAPDAPPIPDIESPRGPNYNSLISEEAGATPRWMSSDPTGEISATKPFARPPVSEGMTRVYRSGEGNFFATNESRAGSYEGPGSYVDIPTERIPEFNAEAGKYGQPTPQDVYLPDEFIRQAKGTDLIREQIDAAPITDMERADLFKELGIVEHQPGEVAPVREPYEKPTVTQIEHPVDVQMAEEKPLADIEPVKGLEATPRQEEAFATEDARQAKRIAQEAKAAQELKAGTHDRYGRPIEQPGTLPEAPPLAEEAPGIPPPEAAPTISPKNLSDLDKFEARAEQTFGPDWRNTAPDEIRQGHERLITAVNKSSINPPIETKATVVQPSERGLPTGEVPIEAPAPDATVTFADFAAARPGIEKKQMIKEWKAYKAKTATPPPGGVIPPEAPIDPGHLPKKPKPAKENIALSQSTSWMKPVVHNFGKLDEGLGKASRNYLNEDAQLSGDFIAYYDRTTKALTDVQKDTVKQLLGGEIKPDAVDPALIKPYESLRNMLETSFNLAEGAGLKPIHRQDYFPHIFVEGKGPKSQFDLNPFESGPGMKGKVDPNLEMARLKDRKDYRQDLDALKDYFKNTSRRIAEARNFGPEWEIPRNLLKNKVTDKYTRDYVEQGLLRMTGRPGRAQLGPLGSKIAGVARHTQAMTDLVFAAPLQLGQFANTAARGGLMRSTRAFAKLAVNRMQGKGGMAGEPFFKAMASGALKPDMMMELSGHSSQGMPIFKNKYVDKMMNGMWGVGRADRGMRVHAYTVGEMLANDAAKGSKSAAKLIKDLGLDPGKTSAAEVGRILSDTTQFKTGPGEIPLWASTDLGKTVFQYQNFMYRYSIFAGEVVRDALHGNVKPLAKLLATGAVVGEGVNNIRAFLKGQELNPDEKKENWNEDEWGKNILRTTKNRRISWNHPQMRLLQNFATIGGMGLLQNMMERVTGPDSSLTALAGGPVLSNVQDLTKKTLEGSKSKRQPGKKAAKAAAKWGIEQIPGYGYPLARKAFPKKSSGFATYDEFSDSSDNVIYE